MKTLNLFSILLLGILAASCSKDLVINKPDQATDEVNILKSAKPQMKIAVMSDIHYLDPSLMTNGAANGAAFQTYLNFDPKLIALSAPILNEAITEIIAAKPDILLIPGDLTKDGEKISHNAVAAMLEEISEKGIKVFVIPGNHDVNNPEAAAYDGDNLSPAENITAEDFASIYAGFGYENAISRDDHSLSYVCQPFNNVWILGIDACKYYENQSGGRSTTSGVIKAGTMQWIKERLAEAKKKNITVLAMMHHGVMEHYTGQQTLDPGYVIDNWQTDSEALIDAGLRVIFTGHYHANDITVRSKDGNSLFDIETGSLVTPPSPFRLIRMDPNWMYIDTKHIVSIDADFPPGLNFLTYSDLFLAGHMDAIFHYLLSNTPYNVPEPFVTQIAPLFTHAMRAHYAGDEKITPLEQAMDDGVAQASPELGMILHNLWTDLTPQDNQLSVDMRKKLR